MEEYFFHSVFPTINIVNTLPLLLQVPLCDVKKGSEVMVEEIHVYICTSGISLIVDIEGKDAGCKGIVILGSRSLTTLIVSKPCSSLVRQEGSKLKDGAFYWDIFCLSKKHPLLISFLVKHRSSIIPEIFVADTVLFDILVLPRKQKGRPIGYITLLTLISRSKRRFSHVWRLIYRLLLMAKLAEPLEGVRNTGKVRNWKVAKSHFLLLVLDKSFALG